LDPQDKNHHNIRAELDALETGAPRYVSRIAIAEVMFGALLDEAVTGRTSPRTAAILRDPADPGGFLTGERLCIFGA
jgi:hypothetical protein